MHSELKQRIKALTPVQQAIYDNRNEATMPKAEMVENVAPDLEKAILENMPESSKEVITDDVISVTEKRSHRVSQNIQLKKKKMMITESLQHFLKIRKKPIRKNRISIRNCR